MLFTAIKTNFDFNSGMRFERIGAALLYPLG